MSAQPAEDYEDPLDPERVSGALGCPGDPLDYLTAQVKVAEQPGDG